MGYNVRKNWIDSFSLILKRPVVILPFIIIAFLEGLALELIYFSPRKPLAYLVNPLIKKFFGENFIHYPGNLIVLPKFFYTAQLLIYIFIGVLLMSISVAIVRNQRLKLPIKRNALVKNALKRYMSFFVYGVIVMVLVFLLNKFDVFVFEKAMRLAFKHLPKIILKISPFILAFFLFLTDIILQTFLVLTLPIIVIKKKIVLKALWESIVLGFRNFLSIFSLILLPFLAYFPLVLLKSNPIKLMDKTFPEINLYVTIFGIVLTVFVECFVLVCTSQFLMDKEGANIRE